MNTANGTRPPRRKTLAQGEVCHEAEAYYLRLMVVAARTGGELDAATRQDARWALNNDASPLRGKVKLLCAAMRALAYSEWHVTFAGAFALGFEAAWTDKAQRNDYDALASALRTAAAWKGRELVAAKESGDARK